MLTMTKWLHDKNWLFVSRLFFPLLNFSKNQTGILNKYVYKLPNCPDIYFQVMQFNNEVILQFLSLTILSYTSENSLTQFFYCQFANLRSALAKLYFCTINNTSLSYNLIILNCNLMLQTKFDSLCWNCHLPIIPILSQHAKSIFAPNYVLRRVEKSNLEY